MEGDSTAANDKAGGAEAPVGARNVIWIASYPKSGNRWMLSILRSAGAKYGFGRDVLGVYQVMAGGTLPDPCPAVAPGYMAKGPVSVLKTHAVHVPGKPLHRVGETDLNTTGFVHIYRNPLDVLLSYINFSRIEYEGYQDATNYRDSLFIDLLGFDQHIGFDEWKGMTLDTIPRKNLDHALRHFSESGLRIPTLVGMSGGWAENVGSWLEAAKTTPNVTLRYEDCIEDPDTMVSLKKLFCFTAADMRAAVRGVGRRAQRGAQGDDEYQTIIYNKMKSYYFVDYFSKDAVEKFLADNDETLRLFGYGDLAGHM